MVFAQPKTFRTGAQSLFGIGKVEIAGERYQAQIQLVRIGSKDALSDEA